MKIPLGWEFMAWLLLLVLVVLVLRSEVRRWRQEPASSGVEFPDDLDKVLESLARALKAKWRREEDRRRIHDPFPIPLRGHVADSDVMDHPANLIGNDGAPVFTVGQQLGVLDDLVEVYRAIPSRRLVVVGPPGSGKTALALRFALGMAERRRTGDPLPVIFEFNSWNAGPFELDTWTASAADLHTWLESRLIDAHPSLGVTNEDQHTVASVLLQAGKIIPVLDGFDEMAEGLHPAALSALNHTRMPLVATSRVDEFAEVVQHVDVMTAALVVNLEPLSLDDVAEYLPRSARISVDADGGVSTVWDATIHQLRDQPETDDLRTVLSSPLMVMLARTVYSDARDTDPAELLDGNRFGSVEELEAHLLSAFVPALIRQSRLSGAASSRRWHPTRLQRWFRFLASNATTWGDKDIAWWQLVRSTPILLRVLVFAGFFSLLIVVPLKVAGVSFHVADVPDGWVVAAACVVPLALGVYLGSARDIDEREPARVHFRINGDSVMRSFSELSSGLLALVMLSVFLVSVIPKTGVFLFDRVAAVFLAIIDSGGGAILMLPGSLIAAVVVALLGLLFLTIAMVAISLWAGIVGGLAARTSRVLEQPVDIAITVSPRRLLALDRGNTLFQSLVISVAFGVLAGAVIVPGIAISLGLEPAILVALSAGAGMGLLIGVVIGAGAKAWGRWALLSRLLLPLTGKLPWSIMAFLEYGHELGVLRQAGAVYHFRHARLQEQLTAEYDADRAGHQLWPPGLRQ